MKGFLAISKKFVELLQGLATILAFCAGAWWFLEQRYNKPQLKLEQTVSQRAVAGKPHAWLLAVDVRATNIGKIKVKLNGGQIKLTQINPLPGQDLRTAALQDLVLEPGESDQALFKTYEIYDTVKTLEIRSKYDVPGSSNLSWSLVSVADIGNAAQKQDASIVPK